MTTIVIAKLTDSVFKDGTSIFNLNLPIPAGVVKLHWLGTSGWIETDVHTDITELPQWALDCISKFEAALIPHPPAPTPTEVCYRTACSLLQQTDWTQLPNSTVLNVEEFAEYRKQVRQYAVNPVANPVWPTKPKTKWG